MDVVELLTTDKDPMNKIKKFLNNISEKKDPFFFVYNIREDSLDLYQT